MRKNDEKGQHCLRLREAPVMIDHGLNEDQLRVIKETLENFAPAVESVSVFGSRATGTYKSYSDIDLVLYGDLDEETIDRLWTCFSESRLPYKVDVTAYNLVTHLPLKEHIDRVAKPLVFE